MRLDRLHSLVPAHQLGLRGLSGKVLLLGRESALIPQLPSELRLRQFLRLPGPAALELQCAAPERLSASVLPREARKALLKLLPLYAALDVQGLPCQSQLTPAELFLEHQLPRAQGRPSVTGPIELLLGEPFLSLLGPTLFPKRLSGQGRPRTDATVKLLAAESLADIELALPFPQGVGELPLLSPERPLVLRQCLGLRQNALEESFLALGL